jgi:hypothetical protein
LANQWYLRRVTDPLGNQIDYKYKAEQSSITTSSCGAGQRSDPWYVSAVYPTEILWNQNITQGLGAGLRVLFTYDAAERLDYAIKYAATNECDQAKFAKNDRLSSVKVDAKVGSSWVTQRTYTLGNSYRFTASATTDQLYTATSGGSSIKRLLLHSIGVQGKSGGTLHTYAFTYQKQTDNNPNQIHLVTADNGWGGKTTYALTNYRVGCPSTICGGVGVRDTRFAVTRTRVEDGLGNSIYTDYYYGSVAATSGSEWGHIGPAPSSLASSASKPPTMP